MEHIVQFAISIDDDTITKRVEERAEKVIIDDIRKKVENAFFEISSTLCQYSLSPVN